MQFTELDNITIQVNDGGTQLATAFKKDKARNPTNWWDSAKCDDAYQSDCSYRYMLSLWGHHTNPAKVAKNDLISA